MSSTRVAAVDCGTNSIRLLVADVAADGTLTELDRRMQIVRLGQGVDRTGELAPEALERTLAASREYAKVAAELGATRVRFVATSATRDARNRDEFAAGVRAALGVDPEVITGQEEAELSFRGATSGEAAGHPGPYLVVDLGGGSTELVLGTTTPDAAVSMDVGSVRLTERHLPSDPPTADEVAAARADVDAALDEAARVVPLGRTATLVGLAGSVTSVTAHALRLPSYQRDAINGTVLGVDDVLTACDDLLRRTREERLALGFMHPGRADVIGAGALIWSQIVARVRDDVAAAGGGLTEVVTSESDILDGIALSLV
ncbi:MULTISPECIES: Ppx/GppA phosphatase family protein [unclassified Isoptericola]|uniref:Ppx/GppA phosphatase family protein n=1 Tax=unclassified Isoptericola TaxID=2623355 RepID=UPI0027124CCB|nr:MULTISPECIES: Ppx/GppA phosphatase family protein [unclassified Isoptericola]MDO8144035.1 Ppx/GppA phosphatase family protein [Isoptericola sp. 178]MDO8149451.1 Ppx/GppA phosphatase family protein [Isoptericola sp. b515]MDO8152398.1 Ppx/GppA phosphatase family protein [Isoptericola sp. b408]